MRIRIATSLDRGKIRNIYLSAFPKGENNVVAKLAIDLLAESTTPETISLVAETDNAVVGHVAFSPVKIDDDDNLQGYILAPLAVMPTYQNNRIGSKLIENGIEALSKSGVNILFVYGDPEYYNRFGFSTESAEKLIPRHKLQYPFGWQAMILNQYSTENLLGNIVCVATLEDPELW
ncbi:MAG: N-acetyltransferase [Gammaproteobacteria bacterium]|nr:N-acetyltransferase [Gammaproteobacteria bacterium]